MYKVAPVFANHWNIPCLLAGHVTALLLLLSYLLPAGHVLWVKLGTEMFIYLNHPLTAGGTWTHFWAVLGSKRADRIGTFLLLLMLMFPGQRKDEPLQSVFCGFLTLTLLLSPLRSWFAEIPELFGYTDHSPSLVVAGAQSLNQLCPHAHVKDHAFNSFPADHATALLSWMTMILLRQRGWRMSALAIGVAVVCTLPRLIAGAHWLSDVVVGAGSILILLFSWAYASPVIGWLHYWVAQLLMPIFQLISYFPGIRQLAFFTCPLRQKRLKAVP